MFTWQKNLLTYKFTKLKFKRVAYDTKNPQMSVCCNNKIRNLWKIIN